MNSKTSLRLDPPHPKEDYSSAARRHLQDALTLLEAKRTDNAAYLAGYVIECSLKKLLEVHGHGAREYGHDLERLSGRALSLAAILSPGSTRYRVDDIEGLQDVVGFWTPVLRYLQTGTLVGSEQMVDVASRVYKGFLVEAILDGNGSLHP
ncbi:HEPN domain-containing protein [Sorangium sp. So ce118]